jgi:hypothetical protein
MTQACCDGLVQKGGSYQVAVFVAVGMTLIRKDYICKNYLEVFFDQY